MSPVRADPETGEIVDLIVIDRLDDDLIVQELQGRAVETWAYRFSEGGQEVTGLTVTGVEQACRESGRHGEAIRITDHTETETDDAFHAVVTAGRYYVAGDGREVLVDTAIGAKREPKLKWSPKNAKWYTDKFAFEKAISKAARNAKGKLLDDGLKAEVVAMALKAGRYRDVPQREQKGARKAVQKEEAPPSAVSVRLDEARRRLFAVAGEMGISESGSLHGALRLPCKGAGNHEDGDPGACHALREAIKASGGDEAAWDTMTARLKTVVGQPPTQLE